MSKTMKAMTTTRTYVRPAVTLTATATATPLAASGDTYVIIRQDNPGQMGEVDTYIDFNTGTVKTGDAITARAKHDVWDSDWDDEE